MNDYARAKRRRNFIPSREQARIAALKEGFERGAYRLPRRVWRYLRRPLMAYANRPRMIQAVWSLATLIGRFHTGTRSFVTRGCGIGAQGAGFFLARKGLCGPNGLKDLTEALVREATRFLIEIGFIERISPKGDLTEVRAPKNAKNPLGYFRTGLKATKDALGRIRSPLTMFRLGSVARSLFAKHLKPSAVQGAALVQEPLWSDPSEIGGRAPNPSVASVHSGCAPYDRAGHDPNDPRFDRWRPDPEKDPHRRPRYSAQDQAVAEATLKAVQETVKASGGLKLSPEASAIFKRAPGLR